MGNDTKKTDILIAILILGSFWGLSEVVLGSLFRQAGIPFRTGMLIGIGMYLMGIAAGSYKKYFMFAGIAVVAILSKLMVVPILGVSVICKANSCLAVLVDGLALLGAATLFRKKIGNNTGSRIICGLTAGFSAAIIFYFAGMKTAPCPNLLTYSQLSGFISYMFNKGLTWMIFSGAFFPLGYILGERLKNTVVNLRMNRPIFYYTASLTLIICCWTAVGLAISAGY